jgi:hypothetical protein
MPEHSNLHGYHYVYLKVYTMSHLPPETLKVKTQHPAILRSMASDLYNNVQLKFSLSAPWRHRPMVNGGNSPLILNLGIWWRRMVKFLSPGHFAPGKEPRYLYWRLQGSYSRSGFSGYSIYGRFVCLYAFYFFEFDGFQFCCLWYVFCGSILF